MKIINNINNHINIISTSLFQQNLTELESELRRKRLKYIQYGTTIQPIIVLVGLDIFSVDSTYARDDDNC
jgi:hypothetical protein